MSEWLSVWIGFIPGQWVLVPGTGLFSLSMWGAEAEAPFCLCNPS